MCFPTSSPAVNLPAEAEDKVCVFLLRPPPLPHRRCAALGGGGGVRDSGSQRGSRCRRSAPGMQRVMLKPVHIPSNTGQTLSGFFPQWEKRKVVTQDLWPSGSRRPRAVCPRQSRSRRQKLDVPTSERLGFSVRLVPLFSSPSERRHQAPRMCAPAGSQEAHNRLAGRWGWVVSPLL